MIRAVIESDIPGLNKLPPLSWHFDYENFLKIYSQDDFFRAFILIKEDKIVGTGNLFQKGKIGWLANIMISEKHRGHGYGLEITKFLVELLKNEGCETQVLLATELGEPIYKRLGFETVSLYQSFESERDIEIEYPKAIRKLKRSDIPSVLALDFSANAENRAHFIEKYYSSGFGYFNKNDELEGFYLPDFGQGLVLSKSKSVGVELLKIKHSKKGMKSMVPAENHESLNFFKKTNYKEGYSCVRMILGKKINWNPALIYSYGSGYSG